MGYTLSDLRASRDDFGLFCKLLDKPRTQFQIDAMALEKRQTVIVAPRQCGKSQTLSLLAAHSALRKPNQIIMIVSASETAATRLLREVRDAFAHPLLVSSLAQEPTQTLIVLSNGSQIISVPASEKSIRGWRVDVLIVDECAFVSDDILLSAALPTTSARPEARVVLASTPMGDASAFYNLAMAGLDDEDPHTRTYRWKLLDAPWISKAVVDAARASLSPLRFRAEYEGEFVTSGDTFFNREDVLACAADFPMRREGDGMPASCGLDWGRAQDAHAIALAAALEDYGVNGRPIVVVPWVETSRRPYGQQVAEVEKLSRSWSMTVRTETNGVGAYPSEELERRLGGWTRVQAHGTSQRTKEDLYGRLQVLFSERGIAIPQDEELIRQLLGITVTVTAMGGLRIAARTEAIHDDLPDAVALAVGGLPAQMELCALVDPPEGTEWAETPAGVRIPLPVRTRAAEPDWGRVYLGEVVQAEVEAAPNPWAAVYGDTGNSTAKTLAKLKELS